MIGWSQMNEKLHDNHMTRNRMMMLDVSVLPMKKTKYNNKHLIVIRLT